MKGFPRTIAISGLGPLQPGMAFVRALREAGYRGHFVGLSYDALEPGNFEPGQIARSVLMPYPRQGEEHYLSRLEEIHRAEPIDVLVATLDSELPLLTRLEPRLRELGIRTLLPTAEQFALRSKVRLPELAARSGMPVPPTQVVWSMEAAHRAAAALGFPVYVKGQLCEAAYAGTTQQLSAAVDRLVRSWGLPLIVQSPVYGVEYDVIVLGGPDGKLLGAVPMKKLQLDDHGKAWGSVTVADPGIDELVVTAMAGLKWRGICELELMRSNLDGRFYVIEINPRTPAWVHLAVAAGQNMPAAVVKMAMGEEVKPFVGYTVGTMSLRQCVDLVCPMGDYAAMVTTGGVDHRVTPPDSLPLPKRRSPRAAR